jgi:hypothetical protein
MSYELQNFSPSTRILRTHMWLDWEPPLPTPLSRWPEYFKVKLKVDAYYPPTHAENRYASGINSVR